MGMYINPPDMSKEEFLRKHGVLFNNADAPPFDFQDGPLPVCLVDNGPFTAAGICFSANEYQAFSRPDDRRPKRWYLVDKGLLEPYM